MKTRTLLSLALSLIDIALCADYHISSADELIGFSNNVNKGTDYKGTTVFLDSDIDFSEATSTFTPIGTEGATSLSNKLFRGIFDGQGHTINNLTLAFSGKHAGLFGYSTGMTVKNVVMGPTCTIENAYEVSLDSIYFGSIIGECEANDGDCIIENSVNMANVTFTGDVKSSGFYSVGGGVYGRFSSEDDKHNAIMRNCANYGTVTQTGIGSKVHLGGLYGGCHGTSSHPCIVENCINAGDVIFTGSATSELFIGGLGGNEYYSNLTSCVSIGSIYTSQATENIGALIGSAKEGTVSMTNCIWTESTNMTSAYGTTADSGKVQSDMTSSATSTLNATTLAILNGNTNGNKWLLNTGGYTVEFYVNGRLTLSTNSLLIQQPDFGEDEDKSVNFNGWYSDASCTDMFLSTEIGSTTRLYGTYGVLYTITFILNSTSQVQSRLTSGTIITYPTEISEVGHSFIGWNNSDYVTVPEHNITFAAQWDVNNYTVTFDLGNGTSFNASFEYSDNIILPQNLIMEGYNFVGWNNSEYTTMPAYGITFAAQWVKNNYTVTFDLGNGTSLNASFEYGDNITFPENLIMEGYSFVDWNNTDNIIEMPAYDITFTAQWAKGELSNWIEIVFNNKDITEEEAKDIIQKFHGEFSFTIEEFGTNDDSSKFIIIKFNDPEEAKTFVNRVVTEDKQLISRVEYVTKEDDNSYSSRLHSMISLLFIYNTMHCIIKIISG